MLRLLLPAAFSVLALSGAARAGEVCNETSFMVEVAKAWRTEAGLAVEGWTRIRPGACAATPPGSAVNEQYIYARSTLAYTGGVREWRGGQTLCVEDGAFSFEGVADCAALGLESRGFRRLDETERERTVLVEPADFGSRAEEAGIQRLLQAAGYDIRLIDGYEGRRTRREIDAFESDAGRSFANDRAALLDALHAAALARNGEAGLHICNRGNRPIAAAIARASGERWESRGWWHVAPGACARPIADRFAQGQVYYYAERLDTGPDGLFAQPLAGGVEAFCTAPARFLVEGRGDCAARSYAQSLFRPAPGPQDGTARVELSDLDFEEALE